MENLKESTKTHWHCVFCTFSYSNIAKEDLQRKLALPCTVEYFVSQNSYTGEEGEPEDGKQKGEETVTGSSLGHNEPVEMSLWVRQVG